MVKGRGFLGVFLVIWASFQPMGLVLRTLFCYRCIGGNATLETKYSVIERNCYNFFGNCSAYAINMVRNVNSSVTIFLVDYEMKVLRDIEINLWLLLLLAAVVAILIYRCGFHFPVPAFDQEALRNLMAR